MSIRTVVPVALLLTALLSGLAFAACGGAAPVGESPAGVRRERTDAGPGEEPAVPDAGEQGEQGSGW